jgi:hypothetical protein
MKTWWKININDKVLYAFGTSDDLEFYLDFFAGDKIMAEAITDKRIISNECAEHGFNLVDEINNIV